MSDEHTQSVRNQKINDLRRWLSIGAVVVLAVILLIYRTAIAAWLVYTFSYLVWSFNLFGRIIPPQGLWIALVVLIVYVAVGSFYGKTLDEDKSRLVSEPVKGPVEAMADWIDERKRGVYFKWRIAHLLGKVHQTHYENTSERMQPPSQEVDAFLDAGINASYMDFPTPRRFVKNEPTVLDIDLEPVLDYLEEEMEIRK
jgi:uncharacterized membrane protein